GPAHLGQLPAGVVGYADIADLAQGQQSIDRRGGLRPIDVGVEDVEDEYVEVAASDRAQQAIDLGEDPGPPEPDLDMIRLTHGHADSGHDLNLFGKSQLAEDRGRDRSRAGQLDKVPTSAFIVVDEALSGPVVDPVPPFEGPE